MWYVSWEARWDVKPALKYMLLKAASAPSFLLPPSLLHPWLWHQTRPTKRGAWALTSLTSTIMSLASFERLWSNPDNVWQVRMNAPSGQLTVGGAEVCLPTTLFEYFFRTFFSLFFTQTLLGSTVGGGEVCRHHSDSLCCCLIVQNTQRLCCCLIVQNAANAENGFWFHGLYYAAAQLKSILNRKQPFDWFWPEIIWRTLPSTRWSTLHVALAWLEGWSSALVWCHMQWPTSVSFWLVHFFCKLAHT